MSSVNIIGAACIDLLIRNVDEDRFFSGSFKAERIISSFGGDALNEALILSKMGLDVKLCAILGDDPNGKLILHELDKNHISYDQNILNKGIDTYISLVFIDSNGERKFVGSENGSLRLLDLDDIKIDEDARIVSFASLFISKVLNDEKLCKLFAYIKENNKILVCDCSKPKNNEDVKDMKCLKYLDYYFCNESEAKALCHNEDLFECERLLYEAGIRNVIIKCGSKGCLYKGEFYPPEQNIDCIDSTCAGDSFVAGFIEGLYRNYDINDCISLANKYGASACKYVGATSWLSHV